MKIAILSTYGGGGGAARAMLRLAKGLSARGHVVDIIQSTQGHVQPNSIVVEPDNATPDQNDDCAQFIEGHYLPSRRTQLSNTFFSFQPSGYDLSQLIREKDYDAINVHWSNQLLNPETAAPLIALGKPVVFTLHDMSHFTGGCHYSAGCDGFERDCAPCPQVSDTLAMAPALLAVRRRTYRRANVAAVAPSHWLADCASRSGVFEPETIQRISNAIETDLFRPLDKAEARQALGLDPSLRYILFGVHYTQETRKGFGLLMEAIERLIASSSPGEGENPDGLGLLLFGEATPELESLGIPVTSFGFVGDDAQLATIYSAADLLILPSLEDNQPNVMMEAMAAGVPVVAFAVGGMTDMIQDGINGRLVAPGDVTALADAVLDLVKAPEKAAGMGQAARRDILTEATLDGQAARYEGLFEKLLGTRPPAIGRAQDEHDAPEPVERAASASIRLPQQVASRVATAEVHAELDLLLAAQAAEEARRLAEIAEAERQALKAAARARSPLGRLKKLRRKISHRLWPVDGQA
ncbi:glycosyltransferase [Mesorhizobium sp. BR1-1-16]|uniref:glycosyltransferase n=1 Tax=Mesorhizobium sp. BR1-1-16 TaxID=2876653 RepID=UPI001CCFF859|nr:glycosyltransferase [Mesorhizobium sp. BR1-1-16]MBZ9939006.1 glycosyltransferase [Mesorhizobium sp. BR1-1-16]